MYSSINGLKYGVDGAGIIEPRKEERWHALDVVAANNSNPGKPVAMDTVQVNGYIPTGIRVSNNSSPYGRMIIQGRIGN